jgi:predicted  nucleic acid-binding Zn-ribbon protein
MGENINNTVQSILLIILVILVAWNIFNTNNIKIDINSYKENIKIIQTQVDSARIFNEEIDVKVSEVKENINLITSEIHIIDKNIKTVRDKIDEKVVSVEFIGNVELERLFTERYTR